MTPISVGGSAVAGAGLAGIGTPSPPSTIKHADMYCRRTARAAARSTLTGQSCAHGSRRPASLAVAIIQGVAIDQTEDVSPFVIRSHDQLGPGRESAPQRLLHVAGRIGALQATRKGVALLLGDDQRGEAAAPPFVLGDAVPLASPRADKGHCISAERRRRNEDGKDRRIQERLHVCSAHVCSGVVQNGAPEEIRTPDPQIRSYVLRFFPSPWP